MVSSRKRLSSGEKKYDAKISKLYQIRGRADFQYSGRAQRAQIQEKKNILIKEFPFPSLSLLKNITEGQLDAVKCAKSLKSQRVISKDEVLMFDEMYLQKCE